MSSQSFKHDLFAQFARVGKALSHANRLEMLEFLAQGERSVESLAQVAGLSVANTSQHLQHLRQAGLVKSHKVGLKVYYSINGDEVVSLLSCLRTVAERNLADVGQLVQQYLESKDKLEPILRTELLTRVREGQVSVIDVRPEEEFNAGHVAGAINVTADKLETYLAGLDPAQEIVAYCRGPHCILAFDAVKQLRDKGFTARRLQDGYPEWQAAGLPVEAGKTLKNSND